MFLCRVNHVVNTNGVKMQHNIVLRDRPACQAGGIVMTSKLHVAVILRFPLAGLCFQSAGELCRASGCISC